MKYETKQKQKFYFKITSILNQPSYNSHLHISQKNKKKHTNIVIRNFIIWLINFVIINVSLKIDCDCVCHLMNFFFIHIWKNKIVFQMSKLTIESIREKKERKKNSDDKCDYIKPEPNESSREIFFPLEKKIPLFNYYYSL